MAAVPTRPPSPWASAVPRNHPLVDGNERLAWAATRVFCLLNARDLTFDVDEAEELVVGVAAGTVDVPDLTAILERHPGPGA